MGRRAIEPHRPADVEVEDDATAIDELEDRSEIRRHSRVQPRDAIPLVEGSLPTVAFELGEPPRPAAALAERKPTGRTVALAEREPTARTVALAQREPTGRTVALASRERSRRSRSGIGLAPGEQGRRSIAGRPRAERRSRPSLADLQPAQALWAPGGARIGRRLPSMSVAFGAVAMYGVASGLHPMAPSVVIALASASSAGLVAGMAASRMLSTTYAVAFASTIASTHAWAQACVSHGAFSTMSFALTALGGALLFDRPRHLAAYLAAIAAAFGISLAASAIPDPLTACLELSLAALATFAITAARARRRARR